MTARQSIGMVIMAALALGEVTTAVAADFPATGQTTCYDSSGNSPMTINCPGTGQDGDIQAGATLRYTDNGDGTIKDKNTGLVWEKQSADGSIHDQGNFLHTWDEAFTVHIADLNNRCANDEDLVCTTKADCAGVGGKCGFAGKRDWRVPNVKELQSIIDYEHSNPAVSAAFNTDCVFGVTTVLTGSCTNSFPYWSSTSSADFPRGAWLVVFSGGHVGANVKSEAFLVRAVRGGL